MALSDKSIWDPEYLYSILYDNKNIRSIYALKSYIEADEPIILLETINNNYKAKIFALMCCFTYIPSIRCIEHLIAEGTPLDKSFDNNPFNCSPQEYLDKHFKYTTNKSHIKARTAIYNAIEKGNLRRKNKEHIVIDINTDDKPSSIKNKISKILLFSLIKH
jgi:hypothetical protein